MITTLGMSGTARVYTTAALLAVTAIPFLFSAKTRTLVAWAVVLLVAAERFGARNTVMLPQHNDPSFFAAPPFSRFLTDRAGADRVLVIKNWARRFPIMDTAGTLYGFNSVQDYEPLAPAAYHDFLGQLENTNVDAPLFWGRFYPPSTHPGWRMLDMMATRYVLVAPDVQWQLPRTGRFELVYSGADARIYENRAALPRAYLANQYRVEPDLAKTLAAVQSPAFDPRAETIVDREVDWHTAAQNAAVTEEVAFREILADRIVLRASTPRPALLVLADLFWPGWRVAVDGDEQRIYRVNYLFRGVSVAPGVHTVRWWYDPITFKVGAVVSATTAVLLIAAEVGRRLLGFGRQRRDSPA